jgi:hypothetical protein
MVALILRGSAVLGTLGASGKATMARQMFSDCSAIGASQSVAVLADGVNQGAIVQFDKVFPSQGEAQFFQAGLGIRLPNVIEHRDKNKQAEGGHERGDDCPVR